MAVSMLDYASIAANVCFYVGEAGVEPQIPAGWTRNSITQFSSSQPNHDNFSDANSLMTMGAYTNGDALVIAF